MRLFLPTCCAMVLLIGCPSGPKEGDAPDIGQVPTEGGGAKGSKATTTATAGEPGPSADALLQHKQADLEGQPNTITLTGEVKCVEGTGPFWIHLFPPPNDPNNPDVASGEGATPPGPITGIEMAAAGSFSIKAPVGGKAMLLAFEDVDKDGFPGAQEPVFFFEDRRPISLEKDLTNMDLTCFKLASPAPDEIGPPPGGGLDPSATPSGHNGPPGSQPGGGAVPGGKPPTGN